jgi:hypothetical protein
MGFPISLLLIAVGAILTWAVESSPSGVNIHVVGVILMVAGFVGFVLSLVWWDRFGPGYWRRSAVYDDGAAPYRRGYGAYGRRRTVVEEDAAAPGAPPAPPAPPEPP